MTAAAHAIPIELLHPSKTNPRKHFDATALDELAASIGKHGILQPILVRAQRSGFEIVAGERRYRAAVRAVTCPECGSTGKWCKRPSGHSGPMVGFHKGRLAAATKKPARGKKS